MPLPPAVAYNVVRSQWHLFVLCTLALVAAAGGCLFAWQQPSSLAICFLGFIWLAALIYGWYVWRNSPVGALRWDGACWYWQDAKRGMGDSVVAPRNVIWLLDGQRWMLVQLVYAQGGGLWLWLSTASCSPVQWLALRRALVFTKENLHSENGSLT